MLLDDLHWIICVGRIWFSGVIDACLLLATKGLPNLTLITSQARRVNYGWQWFTWVADVTNKRDRLAFSHESFHFSEHMLALGPDSAAVPRQPVSSANADLCLSGRHCGRSGGGYQRSATFFKMQFLRLPCWMRSSAKRTRCFRGNSEKNRGFLASGV